MMDPSRRLAMRRAHTKHKDYCTCGKVVCGNGGKASHREMHERKGDGHHPITEDAWRAMFASTPEKGNAMATDGPDPAPCDKELHEKGAVVFIGHSIPPNAFEGWVKELARRSGQRVDWHYVGGRNVVRALGDLARVKDAISATMPEYERLQEQARQRRAACSS